METKEKITTNKLRELLDSFCDKVFKYKGIFVARHGYFYTHGYTVEKFTDRVTQVLKKNNIDIEIVDSGDHWNEWPKDSYFEVRFKVL